MKARLCSLVFLFCIVTAQAQEHSVHGDLTVYCIADNLNDTYLADVERPELAFPLMQDLSLNFNIGTLASVGTDILLRGSLLNLIDADNVTHIAPVTITVNQLFLQVPLADTLMLYAGKRVREMGKAQSFPVVNRINPRLFSQTHVSSEGAGLVELDFFPLYWLDTTAVMFFKDIDAATAKWGDLNALFQADIAVYPVDVSFYAYREKQDNYPLGLSASVQINYVTIYGEYLYTKNSDVKVLTNAGSSDPPEAFQLRDKKHYHALTAGFSYRDNELSMAAEYAWNSNALSVKEADDMKEYIENYGNNFPSGNAETTKEGIIELYHNRNRFMRHYFDVSVGYTPEAFSDISFSLGAVMSFPDFGDNFLRLWGYNAHAGLSYSLKQAVRASFRVDAYGGGEDSEYVLYEAQQYRVILAMNIGF